MESFFRVMLFWEKGRELSDVSGSSLLFYSAKSYNIVYRHKIKKATRREQPSLYQLTLNSNPMKSITNILIYNVIPNYFGFYSFFITTFRIKCYLVN